VERDHVELLQKLVEIPHEFDPPIERRRRREERIKSEDAHLKRQSASGNSPADPPHADHAQCLAG
jgi:hypothetical protein